MEGDRERMEKDTDGLFHPPTCKTKNSTEIHFTSEEKTPNEINMGGVQYVRKNKYLDLKRRVFLLESYLDATRIQIESIKRLLEEIKND